ncbi:tryptophan synthase subunit alpha [Paucilactobacillus hokkaidonensis JCM 18461]|uniref:Tryptophan synthase alpha chain n=2 Tax=Paucilactobacillus hokkaidonensis TaxID=1193095 RepID=A0A0A1H1R4_9LACO|nr:tryptophan synthase subunit alpha [Paucilactobacillus hokkaidonensis]KRO08753.1 tryptophan synthase subunit alpha [Paucilactobacillus hokkaidonensis]BAP86636.1 tryptophan synthase subunit alpha [Paucilactobacillus hokkaidonensis JCM 18461]
MTNLKEAFNNQNTFIGFTVAGDPSVEKSVEYVVAMANAGADIVELGIPFSDPVADGPVIQAADLRAFAAGITTDKIFAMVATIREQTDVPLVFLSYANKIFDYGYERFYQRCEELDVSGTVIPDLPVEERGELLSIAQNHGVAVIPLVAPTSGERVAKIVTGSQGFIYLVSSLGVTGMRDKVAKDLSATIAQIKAVTDTPVAVGFGIHTPEQVQRMNQIADGAIVGSGIVKLIEEHPDSATEAITKYVQEMKGLAQVK